MKPAVIGYSLKDAAIAKIPVAPGQAVFCPRKEWHNIGWGERISVLSIRIPDSALMEAARERQRRTGQVRQHPRRSCVVNGLNRYVQSATLNGVDLPTAWFRHAQIEDGATLVLTMGLASSSWGKTIPPPSMSDANFHGCAVLQGSIHSTK
jgi:hypothetical protein